MLNRFKNISWVLSALVFACCSDAEMNESGQASHQPLEHMNERLPLKEFLSWVIDEENGLTKKKKISDIDYKIAYLPAEQMAYMELKNEPYTEEKFNSTLQNYKNMSYFNFRIELNSQSGEVLKYNLNSAQHYSERINYLAFGMQKDIFMIQNGDTLFSGLYHFERIYDLAPYATVMLAFDDKKFKKENEFSIVFNDHLFNKGYIKYNYKPNQIIDLPNLAGI